MGKSCRRGFCGSFLLLLASLFRGKQPSASFGKGLALLKKAPPVWERQRGGIRRLPAATQPGNVPGSLLPALAAGPSVKRRQRTGRAYPSAEGVEEVLPSSSLVMRIV